MCLPPGARPRCASQTLPRPSALGHLCATQSRAPLVPLLAVWRAGDSGAARGPWGGSWPCRLGSSGPGSGRWGDRGRQAVPSRTGQREDPGSVSCNLCVGRDWPPSRGRCRPIRPHLLAWGSAPGYRCSQAGDGPHPRHGSTEASRACLPCSGGRPLGPGSDRQIGRALCPRPS